MRGRGARLSNDVRLQPTSPADPERDTKVKRADYAEAGIPEYWIIQPSARRVSVYALEGRAYRLLAHFGPGESALAERYDRK